MKKKSILIVDDDENFLEEAKDILSDNGYKVLTAANGREAKKLVKKNMPDVALLDKKLPDIDGHVLAAEIKKISKDTVMIMITAYGTTVSSIKAFRDGIVDYIPKPASIKTMLERINMAISTREKTKKEEHRVKALDKSVEETKIYADLILKLTPSAVFSVNKERRIMSWNRMAEFITGYSAEEVVGKNCSIFSEEPCKENCGLFSDNVKKPIIGRECTIRTKKGRLRNISKSVDLLTDADGNIVGGVESFEDITERKKTEQSLQESQKKFEMLFDGSLDGILVADIANKKFIIGNKAICNMLGYTKEEIRGLGIDDIHPKGDLTHVREQFEAQLKGLINIVLDLPVKRKDGSVFYADVNAVPVLIDGKQCLLGAFRDVSERRKFVKALQHSEEKYRNLMTVIPGIVYIAELPEFNTIYINEEITKSLGFSQAEWISQKDLWMKRVHSEDIKNVRKVFEEVSDRGGFVDLTYRMLHKDGKTIKWFKNIAAISEDGYKKKLMTGVMVDVTDIKIKEEENRFLSRVARDMSEAVWITDKDGLITHCNKSAEEMYGYISDEIIGNNISMFLAETNPPHILDRISKRGEIEGNWFCEVMCSRKNGSHFPVLLRIDSIKVEDDNYIGSIVISMDITEKRLMEDELRRYSSDLEKTVKERTLELKVALEDIKGANEKLKAFDLQKSEFVANVAHEINNPLFIVGESLKQIEEGLAGDISSKARNMLLTSVREVDRLVRFTKNMLDLSKIESGKMPIKKIKLDIKALIDDVIKYFTPEFSKKQVIIDTDIDETLDQLVADKDMIKQVLINLITNALKYTPFGKCLKICAARVGSSLRMEISDQGPGIPEDLRNSIFDKYVRIFMEQKEGTGLGLSIVKEIVEQHKGEVWVESEVGKGSTFIVTLPLL